MVAGEQGPGLKSEERRAHTELKLNSRWAPHQGHNTAFVDLMWRSCSWRRSLAASFIY